LKTKHCFICFFLLGPACQLKFQPPTTNEDLILIANPPTIADFNGDDRFDLASINPHTRGVNVVLGNGDGTFGAAIPSLEFQLFFLGKISVGDFNNDSKLDIAVADERVTVYNIL